MFFIWIKVLLHNAQYLEYPGNFGAYAALPRIFNVLEIRNSVFTTSLFSIISHFWAPLPTLPCAKFCLFNQSKSKISDFRHAWRVKKINFLLKIKDLYNFHLDELFTKEGGTGYYCGIISHHPSSSSTYTGIIMYKMGSSCYFLFKYSSLFSFIRCKDSLWFRVFHSKGYLISSRCFYTVAHENRNLSIIVDSIISISFVIAK